MSFDQCIRESRIYHSLTRPRLQNPNEHITEPEDAKETDLVPELAQSGAYENIVTAMDVFSRHLFAYLTSNQDSKRIAKVIFNIMTKRAYLPTTLVSDLPFEELWNTPGTPESVLRKFSPKQGNYET